MSNGVKDYLKTSSRPRKRAIQQELYQFAAQNLPDKALRVIDLPSVDMKDYNAIKRMTKAGLRVNSYYAYEDDTNIYKSISKFARCKAKNHTGRIIIRNHDVLSDLIARTGRKNKFQGKTIDLFNLDFCSAFADTYMIFQMIHGIALHMSDKAAVIVTCSLRSGTNIKAEKAIDYAFMETMPKLYHTVVMEQERRTYSDTSPMVSKCFILKHYTKVKGTRNVCQPNLKKHTPGRGGRPRKSVTKSEVQQMISLCGGIKTQAARNLNISMTTLNNRLEE